MNHPPTQPPIHPPTNALLPAVILLGALLLSIFLPIMLLFAFAALIWLSIVAFQRAKIIESWHTHHEHQQTALTDLAVRAAWLRSIIDTADIPIIATDAQGTITIANAAAEHTLGSGRPLIATALDELFTHAAVHELTRLALAGESGHARFTLPIAGHPCEFDVAANPLEHGCVFIFRDITELTAAVALKADFAANASHELRTPISAIRGAIDTLAGPAQSDETMRARMIEMISNNATRLELLVNDLLDLSKLESTDTDPAIEPIEIRPLIDQITTQFLPICTRRSVTIEPIIEPTLETLHTDRSLLSLILRNLIENATKFANEGSAIEIRIHRTKATKDPKTQSPQRLTNSPSVTIEIIDQGTGIPIADQQRIFERFYQVDDARSGSPIPRGTGLGLAIVKHATRRLGGSIRVQSIYGQGTTMTVTLPRHLQQPPNEPRP